MEITHATTIKNNYLRDIKALPANYVHIERDAGGRISALKWAYDSKPNPRELVKKAGGQWREGMWRFPTDQNAQQVFDSIVKKYPDWAVIDPDKKECLAGLLFSVVPFEEDGHVGCILPLPLPWLFDDDAIDDLEIIKIEGAKPKEKAVFIFGRDEMDSAISNLIEYLEGKGARMVDAVAEKWAMSPTSKARISVNGWAVEISCDLNDPRHYLLKPEQKIEWKGQWPHGIPVPIPWDGKIHTTRKSWGEWKTRFEEAGIDLEGDDPDIEISSSINFNPTLIPGWQNPACNGYTLHAYQQDGIKFALGRGLKALIGDEMGIGKTAQAIGAAIAGGEKRIFVVCPANARYVWEREIMGWAGPQFGRIQHLKDKLDVLDLDCRWHIMTYDQITTRKETLTFDDPEEEKAFTAVYPSLAKKIAGASKAGRAYPRKISLEQALPTAPAFASQKKQATWARLMGRLRGELVEQVINAGDGLIILDEAHRVKNKNSKRTKILLKIAAEQDKKVLLLTGTPLRNNGYDAVSLLNFLDPTAQDELTKKKGYSLQDLKDYLGYYMIRRTKAEVLTELPEKTRMRIDIDRLDANALDRYRGEIESARIMRQEVIDDGGTESDARVAARGFIEKARGALGMAKVLGGEVVDFVRDVLENKGSCVVFCAHHEVSDKLQAQLHAVKITAAVVDGRTAPKERARIVDEFQAGNLDVFIGGINSAGEAITLTRADTVVFVELDWVPAAMLQAEDRIHRVGQKSNCQVVHLIARIEDEDAANIDTHMIEILGSKMENIGDILDEDAASVVDVLGTSQKEVIDRILGVPRSRACVAEPEQAPAGESLEPDAAPMVAVRKGKKKGTKRGKETEVRKRALGRPAIGGAAMTPAERQRRRREKAQREGRVPYTFTLTREALNIVDNARRAGETKSAAAERIIRSAVS